MGLAWSPIRYVDSIAEDVHTSPVEFLDFALQGTLLHGGWLKNADSRTEPRAFTASTPWMRTGYRAILRQTMAAKILHRE